MLFFDNDDINFFRVVVSKEGFPAFDRKQCLSFVGAYCRTRKVLYRTKGCYLAVPGKVRAPVVQSLDSAIHWLTLCPMENAIDFPNAFPLIEI